MTQRTLTVPRTLLVAGAVALSLAACGGDRDNNVAPPEIGEGAVGTVNVDNAGAAEPPITPTGQAGGPAGQTPGYGAPGGVPTEQRYQADDGTLEEGGLQPVN